MHAGPSFEPCGRDNHRIDKGTFDAVEDRRVRRKKVNIGGVIDYTLKGTIAGVVPVSTEPVLVPATNNGLNIGGNCE